MGRALRFSGGIVMVPVGKIKLRRCRVGWSRPHMCSWPWWSEWSIDIPGEPIGYARHSLGRAKDVIRILKKRVQTNRVPVFDVRAKS
jgi:hypothetical protein